MLAANDISVDAGQARILNGVDFTAKTGEVTAIVGPSGAGKSTLLRVLTGDLRATGYVEINGRALPSFGPADLAQTRSVLPQATPLAFPFTVIEVVRMGRLSPEDSEGIAQQALTRVGLAGFEGRYYQELSGGEQQRVQLARVLSQVWLPVEHGEPRWLFLDEPVSSLDIGHQLHVMQIARDFAQKGGGVVMVMHDLNLTAMSADNVALLTRGKIAIQARPDIVFRSDFLSAAYGCDLSANTVPSNGVFILPQTAKISAAVRQ